VSRTAWPSCPLSFEGRRTDLVALLEQLVSRESPSDDPARVGELSRWISGRLVAAGIPAECVPCEGAGTRFSPRGNGRRNAPPRASRYRLARRTLAERPFQVEGGVATARASST